jgi:hypothetical protein
MLLVAVVSLRSNCNGLKVALPQGSGLPPLLMVTVMGPPSVLKPLKPPVSWTSPLPVPSVRVKLVALVRSVPPLSVRLLATGKPAPSLAWRTPPLTTVGPEYVLTPVSSSVFAASLVRPPVPAMTPA